MCRSIPCRSSGDAAYHKVTTNNGEVVKDSTFKVKKELERGLEAEMCAGIPESDFRGIRVINSDVKFDNISVDTDPMIKYEKY